MNDLHFAQPGWIHLLWGVILFVFGIYLLERRSGELLARFVGVGLQGSLVRAVGPTRRWLRLFFLLAAGIFLTMALMRPQWGFRMVTAPRSGAEIMVCLDVSKSMLAEDVAPNRLERAKAELRDLLPYLRGNQLGLIVFAGRATVLSPLTPDFGFFRLALDQASPKSVSRGGTRLEEPVRKAIAGFGGVGELTRSILLITDGEDQDSFPLEAAREAAKRGIRILAIGFGDEAGSEIVITDPKTKARSVVRDQSGNPVKSRLDGRMLREMALVTEGAYIPAGVGVLDLKAIYERHIAALTKGPVDGTRQSIQNDAFQWAVLMGLLCVVAAVLSTSRVGFGVVGMGILVLGLVVAPGSVMAETLPAKVETPVAKEDGAVQASPPVAPSAEKEIRKPREEYNLGLEKLEKKDFAAARPLLESARERAGTDVELRFRAIYNLGWVEAGSSGAKMESDPKDALAGLSRAASWFREAVSLRPDHEESRYNLEVVLGRAMMLADRLAAKGKGDVVARLEALVQAQRVFLEELGRVVEGMGTKGGSDADPGVRQVFRDLSARQLEIASQGEELGSVAGLELETIRKKGQAERTPQEGMRLHQLELLQEDLHQAEERMGQGRGALRGYHGSRAFRSAATALARLKSARERLLELPARLDALLSDGMELARFTTAGSAFEKEKKEIPAWLTPELLQDLQTVIKERTGTVHQEIHAGLAQGKAPEGKEGAEGLLATLKEAEPLIATAVDRFSKALESLKATDSVAASGHQGEAITGLLQARELFLATKGLLELAWQDENRIKAGFKSEQPKNREFITAALALQEGNLARLRRVGPKIIEELQQARQGNAKGEGDKGDAAAKQEGQGENIRRLERANELQAKCVEKMVMARGELADLVAVPGDADRLVSARNRVDTVLTILGELRQLFFSVEEHLRQVAERQKDLADETQKLEPLAAGQDEEQLKKSTGPLQERQKDLAQTTGAIQDALTQQSAAMKKAPPPGGAEGAAAASGKGGQAPQDVAKRLDEVIPRVEKAKGHMEGAAQGLSALKPDLAAVKGMQGEAVKELLDALELLSSHEQKNDPKDTKGDGEKENADKGDGEGKKGPEQKEKDKDKDSPETRSDGAGARMLQGIRDREAMRKRQRSDRGTMNYEPVEKDW